MASPRRPAPARGRTTRGPLDPGVYWRRRVFVLGVAFALVFGIARALGGGSDASSGDRPVAEQAGARVQPSRTVTAGGTAATGTASTAPTGTASGATVPATPTLAAPQGPCPAADVVVTPSVPAPAAAGGDVRLRLSLQTKTAEACTWQVAPSTVVVKISDGSRQVWTTQQCPQAVPPTPVVVRRAVASVVDLTWNAKESAPGCSRRTAWVTTGDYTIAAAALGGEPASARFDLVKPSAPTATKAPATTKPTATATARATVKPTGKATRKPTRTVD